MEREFHGIAGAIAVRRIIAVLSFSLRKMVVSAPGKRALALAGEVVRDARTLSLTSSFKSCGDRIELYHPVWISHPDCLRVGDDVSINAFVHMWTAGGVTVGNRVMIASHASITSVTHDYNSDWMRSTVVTRPIAIEDDVWIGAHAVIMPGITVGRGAVVGAGCVVTHDVDPYSIVVGVPGRVVGKRGTQAALTLGSDHDGTRR